MEKMSHKRQKMDNQVYSQHQNGSKATIRMRTLGINSHANNLFSALSNSSKRKEAKPTKCYSQNRNKRKLSKKKNRNNRDKQAAEDSIKLLTLFPEETWNHIFRKVCSVATFRQASSASIVFEEMLKVYRTGTTKNSWVNRDLVIQFPKVGDNGKLVDYDLSELVTYLGKFGSHIWCCNIQIDSDTAAEVQVYFYKSLPSILEKMPNMRKLVFNAVCKETLDTERLVYIETQLQKKSSSMPTFTDLQVLDNKDIPNSVLRLLVKKAPQITKVQMISAQCNADRHVSICLEQLPKLESLFLNLTSVREFEDFANSQKTCNLEELELSFDNVYVPWEQILGAVERLCGNTLKCLTLSLPPAQNDDAQQNLSLTLANFQNMNVQIYEQVPLDFSLATNESVEVLEISL